MSTLSWNANWSIGRKVLVPVILFAAISLTFVACSSNSAPEKSTTPGSVERTPAFELPDQFSETYSFTPGDGRDHVFVFYMGYF